MVKNGVPNPESNAGQFGHIRKSLLDFCCANTLPFTPDFGRIYDVKIVVSSYHPIILEDCSSNSCRASITTLKPKIRIN